MTSYILLFVALNVPANLGTFHTETSCRAAIRAIYETKLYGTLIQKTPELDRVIDIQLQYQTSYRCVPK